MKGKIKSKIVKPKFNIHDTVFILRNNKVVQGTIASIRAADCSIGLNDKIELFDFRYTVFMIEVNTDEIRGVEYTSEALFRTKQELLNSL